MQQGSFGKPVRLAYQPPAVFFSHNKPATKQQYFSLRPN
jgi:hypothetical protein